MAYGTPVHNQNKGYASQEKKDLMSDNPIVKDASGGRSWMSKHSQSGFGSSPLNQNAAARVKADNERIAKGMAANAKKAAEKKAKQDKERKERGTKSKARQILDAAKKTMTDKTSKY